MRKMPSRPGPVDLMLGVLGVLGVLGEGAIT